MRKAPNSRVNLDKAIQRFAGDIDMALASELCRKLFKYRRGQEWPTEIVKGETWETTYDGQRRNLPVLPTVDEAVAWANELIAKIDNA